MIKLKKGKRGVRLHGLTTQALLGILVVERVFAEWGQPFVVTSVFDGKHGDKSLHYHGRAFDVRSPKLSDIVVVFEECVDHLGNDWDCLDEGNHWHFEWDPKGPPR